ncbi:MAG: AraC family transcriptional regulator [Lachnospiraceae bacterium]
MMTKYTDLNIRFTIGQTDFIALNLIYERFLRSIPTHSHSNNSYEIHYVPYGYGTAKIDGIKYDITPNTLYVTGPHVKHEQEPQAEDPMVEYCIYLKMERTKAVASADTTDSSILPFLNTCFWYGQDTQNLLPLMQQLFFELETHPLCYRVQVVTLLQQCVIKMIRNYESMSQLDTSPTIQNQFEHANLYDQKYIILEECFLYEYQEITLQKLSARLGLGIRQTERLLKEHYGKTFLQKKTEAKMSAAAILLKDTSKSITAVSEELGYSTLEHFSNAFKRYYRMSARTYRQTLRTLE